MKDSTLIIVAVIAAIPPTLVSLLSLRKSQKNSTAIEKVDANIEKVHVSVNSRMTELLEATKGEANAKGREEGRSENQTK